MSTGLFLGILRGRNSEFRGHKHCVDCTPTQQPVPWLGGDPEAHRGAGTCQRHIVSHSQYLPEAPGLSVQFPTVFPTAPCGKYLAKSEPSGKGTLLQQASMDFPFGMPRALLSWESPFPCCVTGVAAIRPPVVHSGLAELVLRLPNWKSYLGRPSLTQVWQAGMDGQAGPNGFQGDFTLDWLGR